MKKNLIASAIVALSASAPMLSHAEDAPAPAASPVAFNVGVVSDYRYRGISQTRVKPALQGGVDYSGPAGIYLGAWASTIKWIKDLGGKSSYELDLYGGWKGDVGAGLTLDVGALRYQYAKNELNPSANTTEIYGALSYNIATLKYSHSLTNLFGAMDSKSSTYLELAATFDVGSGFTVTPHVGLQNVKHSTIADYTDFSLTVGKDLGNGLSVSVAAVSTDADKTFYYSPKTGKELGKSGAIVGLKYTF
jgi:uncharacterized protein (TIGR02001 family)